LRLSFYLGMFGEDFQICRFRVESVLCVGPVAERFVIGATASAQGSEHFAIEVHEVWTVFRRLDFYCVYDQDDLMDSI
jgi:hypothetical protein